MDEPHTPITAAQSPSAAPRRPTLTLDVALYEGYLADRDLDEGQKRALLEALWSIIVGFVDLGFAVEPAAKPSDGPDGAHEEFARPRRDLVEYSVDSATKEFEKAAEQDRPVPAETWP